jgi:signal transduction histidine kinase
MHFLRSLAETGVNYANSLPERRGIMLANGVSLIIAAFSFLLFIMYFYWYGWSPVTGIIGLSALLCLSTLFLNKIGNTVLSRFWLCLFIPLASTALSIYSKTIYYDMHEELDYFSFRFFILASCVFPAVFFSFKERTYLIAATTMSFLILVSFDPLHELFNVPYRQGTLKISNYSFTNVVIVITYFVMVGAVFIMKWISERSEDRAEKLIYELNEINEDLIEKNTEIEAQNQEIYLQTENLSINQRKLRDANALIAEQRELLFRQNQNLSTELVDKNKSLTDTNTELIKHNNELRQFSFTVSHNLRGPVASLIGLVNLIDGENLHGSEQQIFTHIKSTLAQLDNIIRDLSKIIDIRNDIFRLRQKIELPAELNELAKLFKNEIDSHHIVIKADFSECAEIYSVKALVHSILYNLISNAIKYRSPERQPCIEIKSSCTDDFYVLVVRDNGLGIDLATHRENLFKLYKRFHYHTEGKGLGLYLIKLQAETLGGSVEVESEINKETLFKIILRKPDNVERQILYQEPYAQIFYDARINSTGVIWNGPVTSQQYRAAFLKCLEFVKLYNTPNYIADLSHQGPVSREDQLWMFQEIMPDATSNGLKRIAAIRPDKNEPIVQEYLRGINDTLSKLGARQEFFLTMEEASNWIEEENIKASLNIPV